MTELPAGDPHEVIHLDAEETAALAEYRVQQAAGLVKTVPQAEVRRLFGLAAQ